VIHFDQAFRALTEEFQEFQALPPTENLQKKEESA
jgi:hypothetical protein